jgi:hypothetical protein
MAITLKRTLFIGLGGTGASALLHTKKRFLDTYGEIPPMIGFLSIDTDFNTQTKFLERDNILSEKHKNLNPEVTFDPSELIYTKVKGAEQAYSKQKEDLFSWMPEKNEHVLRNMANGAGQVRSNGRFALHFNYNEIIHSVKAKMNALLNINIPSSSRFQPKGSDIEINYVFSVSGGTGSGSFIDIAYLVKEAIGTTNNVTSIAFLVLPDIFNIMQTGPSMMNVRPNSFGALKDLDFLMRKDVHKLGLNIKYQDKNIEIKSNPYDVVFTVNNKNKAGNTLSDIKEISEQIGLAMFVGASELSANINSAYDNVISVLSGGVLDIGNKRAWAGGMGVSELFYDGNMLGNIYAHRAIVSIINNLITASNDSQKLANQFIDSPEISIRENDGNDFLIDSLLSKQPKTQFPQIDSSEDLKNRIESFINNLQVSSEKEIQENYKVKYKKVINGLKSRINEIINSDSGVANAREFLTDLQQQLNLFNKEMKNEEQDLQSKSDNLNLQIEEDINYLSESKGWGSIFNKSEISNTRDSLSDNVNQKGIFINEILRRKYAQKLLNQLSMDSDIYIENIKILIQRLNKVKVNSTNRANEHHNSAEEKVKTFVIDLHKMDLNKVYAEKDDYIIKDFVDSLNLSNSIYDFHSIGENVIEDYFWKFTKNLKKAKDFVNKDIDDVIRDLPKDKQQKLAQQLLDKSQALWQEDPKGYKVGSSIHDDFVIGLSSQDSAFKNSFNSLINAQNISFVNTGVKNRIVCYRMEVAVPIFGVNDVAGYEKDYRNSSISHHIDENWVTKMTRENFSIWPDEKEDHSLEAWVLGLVYGFIKFSDEKYRIYSLDKGDALDDYWTELSNYRDEAFDFFKRDGYALEMIEQIEERRKNDGETTTHTLVQNVVNNYREEYAQIDLSSDDLKKNHFKPVADLIRREIDFTKKQLN